MSEDGGSSGPRRRGDSLESLRRLGKEVGRSRVGEGDETPPRGRHYRRSLRRSRRVGARRWPRRTLILANVLTALTLIGAGGAYGYVQWRLGQIKRINIVGLHVAGKVPSTKTTPTTSTVPAFTLLVIGSDTRALGAGGGSQFGNSSTVGGQRSDSIILVRVAPKTRSLALLSIPRGTLTQIPGYGTTRINTAFNSGSPSLLVQVLDQDFGIEVNHVALFNFDTFRAVANAVGGVEQYFPSPAKDAFSLLSIPAAGCYNLTGDQALAFVRSREYQYEVNGSWHYQLYPESDLARIQRQQSFFRDLVKKAKKVAPTNPITLNAVVSGITKNLTLDKSFSNSLILSLAQDFHSANLSTLPSYTYPTVNSTSVPGALDPDTQQGQAVIQQWLDVGQTAAAPAKSPAKAAQPVITVNPSSVRIEVENGSGVGNQAGAAGQALAGLGYKTTVSGDAPNFGLTTTEIEYTPDSLAAAKQVQSQLVGGATLIKDSALTPTIYNLDLVTGQSFQGVIGSSSPATPPAPTTTVVASPAYIGTQTVNPDSSSVYDGVYIPPGLQAGQVPQTCGE